MKTYIWENNISASRKFELCTVEPHQASLKTILYASVSETPHNKMLNYMRYEVKRPSPAERPNESGSAAHLVVFP